MGGVERHADIRMLGGARTGDYILVHAGFGIEKVHPEEAKKTLEIIREMGK